MDCKEVTQVINQIQKLKVKLEDHFGEEKWDEAMGTKDEIDAMIESIAPEGLVSIIRQNQKAYDWLMGKDEVDLISEMVKGNIVGLNKEQKKYIEEMGYDRLVIIPGELSRTEIAELVSRRYDEEFGGYAWLSPNAIEDEARSSAMVNPERPQRYYIIAVKSEGDVTYAAPETHLNGINDLDDIIKEANNARPRVNLTGINLAEYLFADVLNYLQIGNHMDEEHFAALPGERITGSDRMLAIKWEDGKYKVGSFDGPFLGARFAVVAREPGGEGQR